MNIDTLKRADGSYRPAMVVDIERCLNAGHTCHLQTERGIIAIRPLSNNGFCVDFQSQFRRFSKDFDAIERRNVIRVALTLLNGTDNGFAPGDEIDVVANQGRRDGYVLATIGSKCIVEYAMPNGTTSLRIVEVIGRKIIGNYKAVSYTKVPQIWLRAIRDAGMTDWVGRGQRSRDRIAFPFHMITE